MIECGLGKFGEFAKMMQPCYLPISLLEEEELLLHTCLPFQKIPCIFRLLYILFTAAVLSSLSRLKVANIVSPHTVL